MARFLDKSVAPGKSAMRSRLDEEIIADLTAEWAGQFHVAGNSKIAISKSKKGQFDTQCVVSFECRHCDSIMQQSKRFPLRKNPNKYLQDLLAQVSTLHHKDSHSNHSLVHVATGEVTQIEVPWSQVPH